MFTKAYLEEQPQEPHRLEEELVRAACEKRGIPVEFYTLKQLQRRRLTLGADVFIAGDMTAMHAAMRLLGIEPPPPNDYPECLRSFMGRRVWRSTLGEIQNHVSRGVDYEIFVKPAERRKRFTGAVFGSPEDFFALEGVSRREPVWCSEVVTWKSEYRVYVLGEDIVAVDHYSGSAEIPLCRETLESAIHAYRASGTAPSAYGIDFGVLSSGQTALMEANDGFALGAYEIAAEPYTDLLFTRWSELLQQAKQTGSAR